MNPEHSAVKFSIERVTPRLAAEWLERNTHNRPISSRSVTMLAERIKRGEWVLNGETIKFADDGTLIDGQHRLHAVFRASMAVDCCVIRGLPAAAFQTIDDGKARTHADCLYTLGYKYHTAVATAARFVRMVELGWSGHGGFRRISNDELLAVIKRYPKLPEIAGEAMRKPVVTHLVPQSVMVFAYFMAAQVHREKARQFFYQVASGNHRKEGSTYPPRVLRDTLVERNVEVIPPGPREKRAWVIECWNAWLAGKGIDRLSRLVDSMPAFVPNPIAKHK